MGAPECPGCRTRDVRIAALENEVRQLRDELRQLKALLGRHAGNSSLPPSANPPAAPPPVQKPKSERRPGAQPGHPPHLKQLLPPERVTRTVTFVPSHCDHCQTPLPRQAGPDDPAPTRFQVADLPPVRAEVIEYQKHGTKCWLWVAATAQVAAFVLHAGRGLAGLAVLLGATISGIVISDRWCAYRHLPVDRRQLCWAHLVRDFQGLIDLGGVAREYGTQLALLAEDVFHWWYRVRDGTMTRGSLRTYLDGQRPWLRALLARGCASGCARPAALCGQLLELEPALWTFVRRQGVEPTNNHAERVLRKAVLWRKKSFGCVSAGGCRFVERILTAVQTLRLQGRPVWRFLQQSLTAHRAHQPAPSLLPG